MKDEEEEEEEETEEVNVEDEDNNNRKESSSSPDRVLAQAEANTSPRAPPGESRTRGVYYACFMALLIS